MDWQPRFDLYAACTDGGSPLIISRSDIGQGHPVAFPVPLRVHADVRVLWAGATPPLGRRAS